MIRRAIVATSLVAFAQTGVALVLAGSPSLSPLKAPAFADTRYLNPMGVALSADGRLAYVALSGVDGVASVDLVTGRTLARLPAGRNPREVHRQGEALVVTDDGPGVLSISLVDGQTHRRELGVNERMMSSNLSLVDLPHKSNSIVPDRMSVFVAQQPHWSRSARFSSVTAAVFENTLVASFVPGSSFSGGLGFAGGGYGGFGGVSVSLDRGLGGAAQPSAFVWHSQSDTLFVAAAGSDTVLGINPEGLRSRLRKADRRAAARSIREMWGGGTFQSEVDRAPAGFVRFRLPTQSNPRHMALSDDGQTLVVSNTLSDSLTVMAVGPLGAHVIKHVALGGPPATAARRGEVLFHSARLSFNGRFACSSCHPGGGSDGQVWQTPTEDAGFARNTKPLFGVRDTAPYGWHGDSPTLADRVRKTLTKLHKHPPKRNEVRELVAYLESLQPLVPSRVDPALTDAVERGRMLFEGWAKCSKCHSDERLTDGQLHDVGTGGQFDTPSLRGVGRRWRLLHDGRAGGPREVFLNAKPGTRHGAAHNLEAREFEDLMIYLKTL